MMKTYVNLADLTQIPLPVFRLTMRDWFDENDAIKDKDKIDGIWIRLKGDPKTIKARKDFLQLLKKQKGILIRIKEVK